MPIEEIHSELVIRRPVKKGSYVLIHFKNGNGHFSCKATVHTASPYARVPGFTPDLSALDPKIVATFEAEKEATMARLRRFFDVKKYPPRVHAHTRATATKTLRELDLTVPVLGSVIKGKVVSLIAHPTLLPTPSYTLGRVTDWEIFNA